MDEAASLAVGACTDGVERLADLGLVARMTIDRAQLALSVCKLALVAVAARSRLLKRSAQLCGKIIKNR